MYAKIGLKFVIAFVSFNTVLSGKETEEYRLNVVNRCMKSFEQTNPETAELVRDFLMRHSAGETKEETWVPNMSPEKNWRAGELETGEETWTPPDTPEIFRQFFYTRDPYAEHTAEEDKPKTWGPVQTPEETERQDETHEETGGPLETHEETGGPLETHEETGGPQETHEETGGPQETHEEAGGPAETNEETLQPS